MKKLLLLFLLLNCSNVKDPLQPLDNVLGSIVETPASKMDLSMKLIGGPMGGSFKAYNVIEGIPSYSVSYLVDAGMYVKKREPSGKPIYNEVILSSEIRNDWCNEGRIRFPTCVYTLVKTPMQEIKFKSEGIIWMKDALGLSMLVNRY